METQLNKINYLGRMETITQYLCESDEQYKARLEFILKLEKDKIIWKDACKISKLYYNITFKKCKYSQETYGLIKKYL
jgi:hypothetical protein